MTIDKIFKDNNKNNKNNNKKSNKNNNNNNNNNNNSAYNINLQPTYTLPQTRNSIRQTSFKNNDVVIINTNDARQTKLRLQRTINETEHIQTTTLDHLLKFIPRQNIVFLEAPPLLITSPYDIYPYNVSTRQLALRRGVQFAETLVGEPHLWKDGYHIQKRHHHLLIKSIAAAAAFVDPHSHYVLARPPHGPFGPRAAPLRRGPSLPPTPSYSYCEAAKKAPLDFRPSSAHVYPLMSRVIQRPWKREVPAPLKTVQRLA